MSNESQVRGLFRNFLEVISDWADEDRYEDTKATLEMFSEDAITAFKEEILPVLYEFYLDQYNQEQGDI